jgi:hypothetical protein
MQIFSPKTVTHQFRPLTFEQTPPCSKKLVSLITDIIAISADFMEIKGYHGKAQVQKIMSEERIHPSFNILREKFQKIKQQVKYTDPQKSAKQIFNCLKSIPTNMVGRISSLAQKILGSNFIKMQGPFKHTGISCFYKVPQYSENIISKASLLKKEAILENIKFNKGTISIQGDKTFKTQVLKSFTKILSYPTGFNLINILLKNRIFIKIEAGEIDEIKYGPTHKIFLSSHIRWYQYTIIKEKKYSYLSPAYAGLAHELVHVLHHFHDFSKPNLIKINNPNLASDWLNEHEAAAIGMAEDNDPFTENNFTGARGSLPKRFGHICIIDFHKLTDLEKLYRCVREKLDGDTEYLLIRKPKLFDLLSYIEKYEILSLAKESKNNDLENLLIRLNCPQTQKIAVFEDFKRYIDEENVTWINHLIEIYPHFFDYSMLLMMKDSTLFEDLPKINEFMDTLYKNQFPPL